MSGPSPWLSRSGRAEEEGAAVAAESLGLGLNYTKCSGNHIISYDSPTLLHAIGYVSLGRQRSSENMVKH